MFNDEKKQNVYRDKQIIIRIVLFLIFIMAPLTLSGCGDDFCSNSDNNTISISVSGEGYFWVRSFWEDEVYFTRSSSFSLNQENKLVTPQCYVLQGWALEEDGDRIGACKNIWLEEQWLIETISPDGVISVKLVDGTIHPVYVIALAMFTAPENLKDEGHGLYSETEKSGQPCTTFSGSNCFNKKTFSGTVDFETF